MGFAIIGWNGEVKAKQSNEGLVGIEANALHGFKRMVSHPTFLIEG